MSAHYWIEARAKRVAVFAAIVVLLALFWFNLPAEVKGGLGGFGRRVPSLRGLMFLGWIGGWFVLLFVRAEDLNIVSPFDYQGLTRIIAGLMIAGALVIGGFFSLAFFA